jgi:hypothetical protein
MAGSWGSFERLGRPLSDLLPARRAFVTRDLAVFVVSTGASRRHRLSLIGAVRGRTLRWFRHGSLPYYARGSITSRAPELEAPTFPSPGCSSTPLGTLSRQRPPRGEHPLVVELNDRVTAPSLGATAGHAYVSQFAPSERFRLPCYQGDPPLGAPKDCYDGTKMTA